LVRQAGGEDKFAYGEAHHIYIRDAFNGGKGLYNSAVELPVTLHKQETLSALAEMVLRPGRSKISRLGPGIHPPEGY
jgi:hypothetical protein